jgi:DnaJ homolog subfamily C member 11
VDVEPPQPNAPRVMDGDDVDDVGDDPGDDAKPFASRDRDLYANLNVSRDASADDIKRAYRALAQVAHPDKHFSPASREAASKSFNKLNEAYEILSCADRRRVYDVYGMAGLEAGLEIGHRNKTLAEITDEFERARAKEARKRAEAKLNFRGTYGFSFSAAHLVDADIARRREALAAKRNAQLSPLVDMNGVDFNSVFDVPLTEDGSTAAFIGAQGQMVRGMGAGGLILGMRSQLDEHTSAECVAVTGSNQSAATASVSRALSEHSSGTLTYSLTQRGIGLEVGAQRVLGKYSKGHLTWNVGPVGGMTTGMQRAKEKHAWKFDVSVGPQNAGVGGFISRKLSKMSTFRLGVRIGSAAMDVDLMCVRKINQETSVGFSVSLGVRGAHWKFRFTHNGQKFLLPVLISPRLTPTLALCAVTIPTIVIAAMKTYVVEPIATRKVEAKQRALRAKYAERVRESKAEAANTAALLFDQAEARTARERENGGLVIECAAYGHFPERGPPRSLDEPFVPGWGADAREEETEKAAAAADGEPAPGMEAASAPKPRPTPWLDVTTATRFMVFDSALDVLEGTHKASLLGYCDPCPGEDAFLRVRYLYREKLHEVTVGEDDELTLPNAKHQLPAALQKEAAAAARGKSKTA